MVSHYPQGNTQRSEQLVHISPQRNHSCSVFVMCRYLPLEDINDRLAVCPSISSSFTHEQAAADRETSPYFVMTLPAWLWWMHVKCSWPPIYQIDFVFIWLGIHFFYFKCRNATKKSRNSQIRCENKNTFRPVRLVFGVEN